MVSKELVLTNAQGFHMRPASVFATAMGKYSCDVTIKFNGNQYNAKSLLNIIAACIKCGSEIEVVCDGADENEALAEAVQLLRTGLANNGPDRPVTRGEDYATRNSRIRGYRNR